MPPVWLTASVAGYLYGVFGGDDGVTARKVVVSAIGVAGVYYLVRKAGK